MYVGACPCKSLQKQVSAVGCIDGAVCICIVVAPGVGANTGVLHSGTVAKKLTIRKMRNGLTKVLSLFTYPIDIDFLQTQSASSVRSLSIILPR